jgi:hypothetical protein
MEISGMVFIVLDSQSGTSNSGNAWVRHAFVIETEGQYPKKIKFDYFSKDPNSKLSISEGDNVTVSFNVESRDYNGKWYSNINAYKVTTEGQRTAQDKPRDLKSYKKPEDTIKNDDDFWNTKTTKAEPIDTGDDLPF